MAKQSLYGPDKIPSKVAPMLCTLVKDLPQLTAYLYEMKWDGYRIVAYKDGKKVRMDSRSGLDYTTKYPPVAEAIKGLTHDVVLDGEVVVFDQNDSPDFDALQKYNGHTTPISYCVFDILWLDGHNLKNIPLVERKKLLKMLVNDHPVFRFSESFEDGETLYKEILKRNLEGIVAKKKIAFTGKTPEATIG